jgi:pimeloyl-[acyl-carrier protein] methyl ester esterase
MPSLILITGWAHSAISLKPLAAGLASCFSVHCVSPHDLKGSDYVRGLITLIEEQTIPVILAGWSMGGMIALQAAAMRPNLVSHLVLISSSARFCSAPDYPCGQAPGKIQSLIAGLERVPERMLGRFYDQSCAPERTNPAARENFIVNAMRFGTPELIRGLDHLALSDLRPLIRQTKTLTLLIHGDADSIIPCAASEYLAKHHPSARLILKNGAGHNLPVDDAEFTADIVCSFVKRGLND